MEKQTYIYYGNKTESSNDKTGAVTVQYITADGLLVRYCCEYIDGNKKNPCKYYFLFLFH